jgi:hypothetical protein
LVPQLTLGRCQSLAQHRRRQCHGRAQRLPRVSTRPSWAATRPATSPPRAVGPDARGDRRLALARGARQGGAGHDGGGGHNRLRLTKVLHLGAPQACGGAADHVGRRAGLRRAAAGVLIRSFNQIEEVHCAEAVTGGDHAVGQTEHAENGAVSSEHGEHFPGACVPYPHRPIVPARDQPPVS